MENLLDCKGLKCPLPIVKISQAIKTMQIGQLLEVEATDASFVNDINAWARVTGNTLVNLETGPIIKVIIQKN